MDSGSRLTADEADRWLCTACGGKRWWRTDHERGTAEKGYVTTDYAVTQ
jgi:hypothetical protein